jgi:glycosyltransferase involved in cell wall biosynthesis
MLRILHIARYRNTMMESKIALIRDQGGFDFFLVRPKYFKDMFGLSNENSSSQTLNSTLWVPFIGKIDDPHRAFYRTATFAMKKFAPHIIHAEEEPDSLSALQIIIAHRILAPASRMILHTYQNVNRPKGLIVRSVLKTTLKGSDAILCANSDAVRVLKEYDYKGMTEVIPPEGVDTTFFKPFKTQRPLEHFTVVFAGRFVPEKGLDTLFHAIKLLDRDVRLLMVGAGPQEYKLRSLTEQLNIKKQVVFLGPQKSSEMPVLINQADVLVLPSRSSPVWKEQYGRVLLEAMACKVPVIGSDNGAIPEVIGDAGLIFTEDDVGSLAQCLHSIMESRDLRKELAERGYLRATGIFNQKEIAARTAKFYRRIVFGQDSDD